MNWNRISIQRLGEGCGGYRIWISWKRPKRRRGGKDYEAWIPQLAPAYTIRRRFNSGAITWRRFVKDYTRQLGQPSAQNALKPIALLSQRRKIVLLCDCDRASERPHSYERHRSGIPSANLGQKCRPQVVMGKSALRHPGCPARVLAAMLEECRKRRDFALELS